MKRLDQTLRLVPLLCALFWAGCQRRTNAEWDTRVGKATYDEVVRDLGPPDRETRLSDGSRVGDWFQRRGGRWFTTYQSYPDGFTTYGQSLEFPDRLIRLTFDKDGMLEGWKTVYR